MIGSPVKASRTKVIVIVGADAQDLEDNINTWLATAGELVLHDMISLSDLTVLILYTG